MDKSEPEVVEKPPLPVQSIAAIIWLATSRRKDRQEAGIVGRRVKAYARTIEAGPLLEGLREYAAAGYHALGFTAQAARDRSAAARERLREAEKRTEESELTRGWRNINLQLVAHGLPTVNGSILQRIRSTDRPNCVTPECTGLALYPAKHCLGCQRRNSRRRPAPSVPKAVSVQKPSKEFLEDALPLPPRPRKEFLEDAVD